MCDSGVFVGNLWAEREERGRGRGRGEGEGKGRGRGPDGEEEGGGRVLWALGGNLCLAF